MTACVIIILVLGAGAGADAGAGAGAGRDERNLDMLAGVAGAEASSA